VLSEVERIGFGDYSRAVLIEGKSLKRKPSSINHCCKTAFLGDRHNCESSLSENFEDLGKSIVDPAMDLDDDLLDEGPVFVSDTSQNSAFPALHIQF
jgi:hypothetical protein